MRNRDMNDLEQIVNGKIAFKVNTDKGTTLMQADQIELTYTKLPNPNYVRLDYSILSESKQLAIHDRGWELTTAKLTNEIGQTRWNSGVQVMTYHDTSKVVVIKDLGELLVPTHDLHPDIIELSSDTISDTILLSIHKLDITKLPYYLTTDPQEAITYTDEITEMLFKYKRCYFKSIAVGNFTVQRDMVTLGLSTNTLTLLMSPKLSASMIKSHSTAYQMTEIKEYGEEEETLVMSYLEQGATIDYSKILLNPELRRFLISIRVTPLTESTIANRALMTGHYEHVIVQADESVNMQVDEYDITVKPTKVRFYTRTTSRIPDMTDHNLRRAILVLVDEYTTDRYTHVRYTHVRYTALRKIDTRTVSMKVKIGHIALEIIIRKEGT